MLAPAKIATALAAAALLVPGAGAPDADAAKRRVPPQFMGITWDSAIRSAPEGLQERQFPKMAAAGAETMRVAFHWGNAQLERDGPIDLSETDRIVERASARRIEVFPHIIVAPTWNRAYSSAPHAPPGDPEYLRPYMKALIERYGPSGSFWAEHPGLPRLPIRHWQFWNEPHLPYQWTLPRGISWSETYAAQLKVFHLAVKENDPTAKVVLGGLTNSSWLALDELYENGVKGYFDIAAIHPYTQRPKGPVELTRRFRAVMRRNGDGRKPVWATELGLPASRGRSRSKSKLQTTDRGMASFLEGSYAALADARRKRSTRVDRVYWYTWASEYRGDIFRYTGLFRYAGKGRPAKRRAFGAYVRTARGLEGCVKTSAGRCR